MFKKKQAKKLIFDHKMALRTECSDPARNHQFCADFLNARFQCSQLLRNCGNIKPLHRRARGEWGLDIAQTIGPNCSMTHSPGKMENNCRYFIMTFRTQIHQKKFGKKCFRNLQGTMSHRPLTNTSSLKIAAAYSPVRKFNRSPLSFPLSYSMVVIQKDNGLLLDKHLWTSL